MSTEKLHINIWDDYTEDGDGAQATHAYVEGDATTAEQKDQLEVMLQVFTQWCAKHAPDVTAELVWHEPLKVYPNMAGTGFEFMYQPSWRVNIRRLTHEQREAFVRFAKENGDRLPGIHLISES